MKPDINDYIKYRFDRSYETLQDAKLLAENKSWNSCINRLYYACYYAVNALLIKRGITAKTHNGVRTTFLNEYVKTKKINSEFGKFYNDLFDWRQEGDYSDFTKFDSEVVLPLLNLSEKFIKFIEDLIAHK